MPDAHVFNPVILIVDDDHSARVTLDGLLARQGLNLIFAKDGPEALHLLQAHSPDLVLLDIMMPGLNGFEVCRRIRANPAIGDVPIILITALDDRNSRLEGIEAGADDFITKPYDAIELRSRVKSITRLNRYRRLHQERAKFEWVVANSERGYLILDAQDQIHYANDAAQTMLQISDPSQAPIQEKFTDLMNRSFRCLSPEAWATWPEPVQSGVEFLPRYLIRPETSTSPAFWLKVETLKLEGADRGNLVRISDISDQMKLRQDIWRFHTVVSHKLRSPLSGFKGSLDFLAQDVADLSKAEIEDFSRMASISAQRLLNVVQDVLQFCSGPKIAPAGIGFSLAHLPSKVREASQHAGLPNVRVSLGEGLNQLRVPVAADPLDLILIELLENAKKFHPQLSPGVAVSAECQRPGFVTLRVTDDGVTLHPQQLARVWVPYYQCEKVFTGEVDGSGLGLPMIASIVWSVGGNCRIHNNEGRPGVTVELELPVAS